MTDRKLFGPERKPWDDPVDDRLAPSSYAATALFGIVELAVETLHEHGYDLSSRRVGQYSQLFARILIRAQVELGEGGAWASALNTRLRGALRTAIRIIPFDESDQESTDLSMQAWEEELYALVVSIAKTAAWLYARGPEKILGATS